MIWFDLLVLVAYIPGAIVTVRYIRDLKLKLADQTSKLNITLSQKKSTEVRTGLIVEKLAPLSKIYPFNPENAHFLGQPIDYVQFDDDAIRIVEIKSGGAQLSKKQRKIRDLITAGKVEFYLIRVDDGEVEDGTNQS